MLFRSVTVQNTVGVRGIHAVPTDVIAAQIECVLDDIGTDAIKTGMLGGVAAVRAVTDVLKRKASGIPLVVDPVMVAKGGASLLADDAVATLRETLLPLATLLTPNTPEAERLTARSVGSEADQVAVGKALLAMGAKAVLVKGGHMAGDIVADALVTNSSVTWFRGPRITSTSTHGTGCTLASACAAGLAQGMTLQDAVARAHAYVQQAIKSAPGFGADRKSTRLNSSHSQQSRMPSSA